MGFRSVLSTCVIIVILHAFVLSRRPDDQDDVSMEHVVSSSVPAIPPTALLVFRLFSFLVISANNIHMLTTKDPLLVGGTTRFQETRQVSLMNLGRFTTFTVWCWCLQGMYFGLTIFCTVVPTSVLDRLHPKSLAFAAWVLFEISLPTSILVTLIVTYVLYPFLVQNKADFSLFFKTPSLLMHNFNLLFMMVELLSNGFPSVNPWHAPFGVFYGLTYVVFSWCWEYCGGVFYYFFLNYTHKRAVVFYIGLVSALNIFFFIGWLLKSEMSAHPTATLVAMILIMPQMMMFRPYKVKPR